MTEHFILRGETDRKGYVYYREAQPVGYGYVGLRSGPFILLDANDFPAVLAHAENEVAAQGHEAFGLEVPMVNHPAHHLSYRADGRSRLTR
jgi:hypothetical protein